MDPDRTALRQQLQQLERELTQLGLWRPQAPAPEALASTEPFCVDTLCLSEWLQWLLIPRLHALLDGDLPLPASCAISAIAEESFKEQDRDCSRLLALIAQIDATVTRAD